MKLIFIFYDKKITVLSYENFPKTIDWVATNRNIFEKSNSWIYIILLFQSIW